MNKAQKYQIAFLKEKLEGLTGKKVILEREMGEEERRRDAEELRKIQNQVLNLMSKAEEILADYPRLRAQASSYWLTRIKNNASGEGVGSMVNMDETIEKLENNE